MRGFVIYLKSAIIDGPYLTEDCVAVVGEDDAAHWVEEHLEHGLGTKGGSHNVRNCFSCLNVGRLSFLALLALSIGVEDHDRRLHGVDL